MVLGRSLWVSWSSSLLCVARKGVWTNRSCYQEQNRETVSPTGKIEQHSNVLLLMFVLC